MDDRVFPAPFGTAHSPKISGTRTFRCPLLFRTIVKRHAMTCSRLGRYAETGQPRVSVGRGRAWLPVQEKDPVKNYVLIFMICLRAIWIKFQRYLF